MNGTNTNTDPVTNYYKAQGKHDRQLNRITSKILGRWKDKDFAALKATRAERDSAVAALSHEQRLQHYERLSPEQIKAKLQEAAKRKAVSFEDTDGRLGSAA